MIRPPDARRRRRAAAYACPGCGRAWAVRGVRTAAGPWLLTCRYCSWCDLVGSVAQGPARPEGKHPACEHAVRLYARDEDLIGPLADYLSEGWARGGSGIVIATAPHRAALRHELAARGLTAAMRNGRLVELDAAQTLQLFMRHGRPDPLLFQHTVGSLVRGHATAPSLRAFGEMVDVLWEAGHAVAALELEQLWGTLQEEIPFALLCAYAEEHLDDAGRRLVYGAHRTVA